MTPLQVYIAALGDLVELAPEAYSWFIAIATELVGLEAARLFIGEALSAVREDAA
jgi:hypothetical protein